MVLGFFVDGAVLVLVFFAVELLVLVLVPVLSGKGRVFVDDDDDDDDEAEAAAAEEDGGGGDNDNGGGDDGKDQ
mgnify:CR=1 FL=1